MKRFIAPALAALLVAGAATPSLAQRGEQLRQRTDQLEHRIRAGAADGSLDRREADRAQNELNNVRRLERDLLARNRGFLTPGDRTLVSSRLDSVERSIHWLRANDRVARPGQFNYGFGRDFWRGAPQALQARLDWLENRVRRGADNGSLTRGETDRAMGLLRDFRRQRDDLRNRHGRLSPADERFLDGRLTTISQQIRWLQNNRRRD
jgi:hypothetical protein